MKRHPDFEHYDANTEIIHAVTSSAKVSPIVNTSLPFLTLQHSSHSSHIQ